MANTIKLRRSATPGAVPTTSQIALGELGVNHADGKLFLKRSTNGAETGATTSILSAAVLENAQTFTAAQTISVTDNSNPALKITQTGTANALVVEDEASDTTPFVVTAAGNVGIGTTTAQAKLHVKEDTNKNIYIGAGTGSSARISAANDANNALVQLDVQGSEVSFTTAALERARFDSSGRFLVGTSSVVTTSLLEVNSTNPANTVSLSRQVADNSGPRLLFVKTRGSTSSIVSSGDTLGEIRFRGSDGVDVASSGAYITAFVDGTPGATDMPGRLVFSTAADGASSPTERMTIKASGNVGINQTSPGSTLDVKGTLRLSGATSGYVGFAPADAAGTVTYTLPSAAPSVSGQVLSSTTGGTMSWITPSGSGDVVLASNNAFTGANTFTNTTGQIFRQAATQDGVLLRGRGGGTSSYTVEITPATLSASRTITCPDGDVTLTAGTSAVLGTAQTFTAANTFRAANAIRSEAASTQDAVVIAGRAGGTSSYAVTITPTTLGANRTLTLPDASTTVVGTDTTQTLTAKTLTDPAIIGTILEDVYTITDGAAFEIDPGNGSIQLITLGASRTPKATNFAAGEAVTLMVDDGTAYALTWTDATWGGTGVVWKTNSAAAPTLNTTGYTVIVLWKVSSQVYGARVGDS